MKFNRGFLIAWALFSGCLFSASADNIKDLHSQVHKQHLANTKSAIDKSVIQDFILNDIQEREEKKPASGISKEMEMMLTDLISEAKSHLGKKYRSGGKGPSAFDCSGFSSYVYRQFGFSLGASSRDQFKEGEKIDIKDLRTGDLVFFTGRNSKGGVGHVGIVVEADNEKGSFKFIHAATSGGIRIDTNKGYYGGRYLGARRIINL